MTHLAGGGDSDSAGPVVVHVSHLVGQPLHVVWLQSGRVVYHSVVGGCDSTLTNFLTHQEEIIAREEVKSHVRSHDSHMTYIPLRVMVWSTTVPGGGLARPDLCRQKILVEILFCTTTTAISGW